MALRRFLTVWTEDKGIKQHIENRECVVITWYTYKKQQQIDRTSKYENNREITSLQFKITALLKYETCVNETSLASQNTQKRNVKLEH